MDEDSGYARLEDQIRWYDGKSGSNQWWFKRLKVLEIAAAAAVPVTAGFLPSWVPAMLGAAIVIVEGVQAINQYQHNWESYRSTCEALRHEKFLFMGRADPYDLPDDEARKLLAQRVESLVSREHAKWVANRQRSSKQEAKKG